MSDIDLKSQAALFAKMARVMGRLSRIEKRGHNQKFNYDYVSSEDVADAVRAALAAENVGFFASQGAMDTRAMKSQSGTEGTHVIIDFVFTFADGETGATFSCQWRGEAQDYQDKSISKAATSAEKYFLMKTFIISSGDDPDPDDDGDKTRKPAQQKQAQTKPNGNGSKPTQPPAPLDEPPQPEDPPTDETMYQAGTAAGGKLSLESAKAVTNSEGEKYGDLPTAKLASILNGIGKALQKSDVTPERRDELLYKRDAAQVIIAARQAEQN